MSTLTLWGLIQAITVIPQPLYGLQKIQSLIPAAFKTTSNNDYWERQQSEAIELEPGLQALVEIAKRHKDGAIGLFILKLKYEQCITRSMLKQRYPDLAVGMPANNPAPGASTYWRAVVNQRTVSFGFRNRDFECLSSVTVDFNAPS
jgi:hypothetical protein